jgi:crotonobetainyl-CoA:carnitine CoA-transferase CaiB-like acyl-CoA transferase
MGRVADGFAAPHASFEEMTEEYDSGFGKLVALRHAPKFSRTPARWLRRSMPPGSHAPVWPAN